MSIAVIGLGPMGAAIGRHLQDTGRDVVGLDLDSTRVAQWFADGLQAFPNSADVPWQEVDTVLVAVRLIEHLRASMEDLAARLPERPIRVIVITTLAVSDAREYLPTLPSLWRVFELPVSGGPEGARVGSLSAVLAGPEPTAEESQLLQAIAPRIFETGGYGEPAALKLLNNALGAYVAAATGSMAELAESFGVPAALFLRVARASSGQSWMADHFEGFHYPLLIKDVHLLQRDVGTLPIVDLNTPEVLDEIVPSIRRRLNEKETR